MDGLSTILSYGYSEGKSKSSYAGDKYIDLDSVPPMKAIVGMAWDDPNKQYGTALTATFVKGKRADVTTRESYSNSGTPLAKSTDRYMRVPGYGLLDWTAYWQVAKNVKLNGGIYNITDRKYWDYLNSRNRELNTAQDANDKALSVMPGRTAARGQRRLLIVNLRRVSAARSPAGSALHNQTPSPAPARTAPSCGPLRNPGGAAALPARRCPPP